MNLSEDGICKTTRDTHEQEWIDEQSDNSAALAQEFVDLADKIRALPATKEEANKLVVADSLQSLIEVANQMGSDQFTKTQFQSTILLGRGLTKREVAEALDIPGGESMLHEWHRQDIAYRKLVGYWREEAENEHFSKAVREIEMLADKTDSANLRLKLLKLRLDLAYKPEDRHRWKAEISLREREVVAHEKEADRGVNAAPPFPLPDDGVLDVEFTAKDGSGL